MAEEVMDVKPKRKNAGNRMKDVMEAIRSPKVYPFQAEEGGLSLRPNGDIRTPRSATQQVVSNETDTLHGECEGLRDELECLRLEKMKRELNGEIHNLKRELACGDHVDNGSRNEARGEGRQDGGAHAERKQKPLEYTDHLWMESLDTPRQKIEIGEGLSLEIGAKSRNLSKITVEMWVYANIGLLRDMVSGGRVDQCQVDDYLKYMQDITRYSAKYMWPSVILYDQEYRMLQAKEGFRWGTPSQDLRDHQLVPKPTTSTAKVSNRPPDVTFPRGPFTPDGQEICRRFNTTYCREESCRLMHVCTACFRRHSRLDHSFATEQHQARAITGKDEPAKNEWRTGNPTR